MATSNRIALAILSGGLSAGVIDFVAACLIYQLPPLTVGKAVARGWFGPSAMKAGTDVAVIGIASHFAILIVAAAIFVGEALRAPILRQQAWISGLLFGLAVYAVMHFVIIPLSNAPNNQPTGLHLWEELASHLLVGLAIALCARGALGKA